MKNLLMSLFAIVLLPVLAVYHALYWLFIVSPKGNEDEDEEGIVYCDVCGLDYDIEDPCRLH